jgi:hypothetical protein
MSRLILKMAVGLLVVLPLSGCPGITALPYGVWFFTVQLGSGEPQTNVGLVIFQNGFTADAPPSYPGNNNFFSGPITWQRDGANITLVLDTVVDSIFDGTIDSPTTMNGIILTADTQAQIGTWSALYGPDNS